jgi:nucleoside-diphosphate-sugar epimerase
MKVLVVGCCDALARATIARLLADGHEVTVGVQSDRSHPAVRALGARPMLAATARQLTLAADDCDAVCHLAPLVPPPRGSLATLSQLAAVRRARRVLGQLEQALSRITVPRLVQRSSVSLYPDRQDRWINEACPTSPHRRSRLCADAERVAVALPTQRGSVVLRFAHPWGADDPATRAWLLAARNGYHLLDLPAGTYWPTIHLADAAAAVSAALTAPQGCYNVAEPDPQPFEAVTAAVRDAVGHDRLHPLPATLSRADAGLYLRSHRVDNTALCTVSGWHATHSLITHLAEAASCLPPYRLHEGWGAGVPW